MIGRRTRPLLALFACGAAALALRLFQVQVGEHEVWAGEAARQVGFGRLLPYQRGSIEDAQGVPLARDKETHHLVLVYRDFRRAHPLGLLAHARSLLEGRPVPLSEAHEELLYWTRELLLLSPAEVEAFGRGEALAKESLALPAAREEERGVRARRASDLRFYVRRLLDLQPRQWAGLLGDLSSEERGQSFLALCARRVDRVDDPERVWARVEARLAQSEDHLQRLARRLAWPEDDGRQPLERLIAEIEASRRWVEDATAAKLFGEAAGFPPGRVGAEVLRAGFDLDWIARLLGWDARRLDEWVVTARQGWLDGWRDGYALPHLVAALRLEPEPAPDDALDLFASLFLPHGALERALDGEPEAWRAAGALDVLGTLAEVCALPEPPALAGLARGALPFQDPALRALEVRPEVRWQRLDALLSTPPEAPALGRVFEAALEPLRGVPRRGGEALGEAARVLVDDWERAFQAALARGVGLLQEVARERGGAGRLVLDEDRRDRALERTDYFLKDYGLRPRSLVPGEPDYDVVYLLSRYEEFYPGFEVREARERVYPVAEGDPARLAGRLLGRVSTISAFDVQSQRAEQRRLRELRDTRRRSDDEESELLELVGKVLQSDDVKGVSGLERCLEPELVGTNGYFETRGLDDLSSEARTFSSEPVDGLDVRLTLRSDLQRAAERTLREPRPVPEDERFDWAWNAAPVGAIVLATVDGDVLVAASEPGEGSPDVEDAAGQRGLVIDRTLRIPDFQPPGSVFKPFVAAWALDHSGLDPGATVVCGPIERGGAGYADVRCHQTWGHGPVDLRAALVGSCNAYFAWLGERLTTEDFRGLAALFGFDRATGVRLDPEGGPLPRAAPLEETRAPFRRPLNDFERRRAGNGLTVVESTPVQLARATIGLATGRLPAMRLVGAVGGEPAARRPAERLDLSPAGLDFVRSALCGVTSEPGGTARNALSPVELGFAVAAKTGSADIESRAPEGEEQKSVVRKHTWVTGWVPASAPRAVFVIFMHDTESTSSHGAVYLARQFLLQPEVLEWLASEGVQGARR